MVTSGAAFEDDTGQDIDHRWKAWGGWKEKNQDESGGAKDDKWDQRARSHEDSGGWKGNEWEHRACNDEGNGGWKGNAWHDAARA